MKSIAIVCAIATAASSFSGIAFAQEYRRGDRFDSRPEARQDRRDNDRHEARGDRRGSREADRRDGRRWEAQRHDSHRHATPSYRHVQPAPQYRYVQPAPQYRYVQPAPQYYYSHTPRYVRGGYLPYEYRQPRYVVHDWRAHRLYAPPYGHQWVQVGNDYLLIAIATGIIASLLLASR